MTAKPRTLEEVCSYVSKTLCGSDKKAADLTARFMLAEMRTWLNQYSIRDSKQD
jgi:hypothetical protein